MKLQTFSLVAVLLTVLMLPVVPAATVRVQEPYAGPAVLTYQGLGDCDPAALGHAGTACLDIPAGASRMDLRVLDETGLAVGGTYYLHDSAGEYVASGTFCRGASLDVGGAAVAVIRLEAINGPLACAGSASGLATKGVVTARLH